MSTFSVSRSRLLLLFGIAVFLCASLLTARSAHASCSSPANAIEAENCNTGNPVTEWDIAYSVASGDPSIQGYATDISFNVGQTVSFKVNTTATNYVLNIYRMGYYGGMGARKIATVTPSVHLPQTQPACAYDNVAQLVDCGNWAASATWQIPATATPGLYFAHLIRSDTGGDSHIFFVVRNDSSTSAVVYQTSDTTWQAYNNYGGHYLYGTTVSDLPNRAYKVSYNRPINTRTNSNTSNVFYAEYPMIRWLEANSYDVTYISGLDSSRNGSLLLNHKVFLSSGHDEYWDGVQRQNVEAARDAGVNLAFFSGNEVFWKTRWETSIDGTNTPNRTLVCYKETFQDVVDPMDPPVWTGSWRDPSKSPPADGGRPQNNLTGTLFMVNGPGDDNIFLSMKVPSADGKMRFWRNTTLASLPSNQTATLPQGTLGYEWDVDPDNLVRPPGLFHLSTATYALTTDYLLDYGVTYGAGTATHNSTMYRAHSGALVFGAGTVQWSWGLDSNHDGGINPDPDTDMQQATVNLFADMGVQPATLQSGLQRATASTDTVPPVSTIISPAPGTTVNSGAVITVSGTATDTGGGVVGGVEVSLDGGNTWHPAVGRSNWTYAWTPSVVGNTSLMSRAVDDSGNIENPQTSGGNPSNGVQVAVNPQVCPCTIWNSSAAPSSADSGDANSIEVGVKFRTDNDGVITGIRFFKSATNVGTHVAHLWTSSGTLLGTATFTAESGSGWQQVQFTTPVPVTANTVYVASYFAPSGHYSADLGYFLGNGVDNPPVHALANGVSGLNALYSYTGTAGKFPSNSYNGSNYWVDVVFVSGTTFDISGQVSGVGGAGATVTLSGAANAATSTDSAGNYSFAGLVNGTYTVTPSNAGVTFTPANQTVVLNSLSVNNVNFNAAVTNPLSISGNISGSGGSGATIYLTGPGSVTTTADSTGNYSFSGLIFGTYTVTPNTAGYIYTPAAQTVTLTNANASGVNFAGQPCPCTTIWPSTATPTTVDGGDPNSVELGVKFKSDVSGHIQALRFYKAGTNTGTHIGNIWSNTGALLGSAIFTNETASGWQEVVFSPPVAVAANTTYVASYFAPSGHYSYDVNYFQSSGVDNPPLHALADGVNGPDGVYVYGSSSTYPGSGNGTNYWVDVVFVPTPPHNLSGTISGAGGPGATVALSGGTTVTTIADASGNFSFTNVYDGTYVLTPSQPGVAFTTSSQSVTVNGADVSGITFATLSNCAPCDSIWQGTAAPVKADSGDTESVNVGVKFRADSDGFIAGLRFYKSNLNTGTHVGSVWSSSGAQLATVVFTNESPSGWQQAIFSNPVSIVANTTYVVSYLAPQGHYSADNNYFATSGIDTPPLHALAEGADGSNGLFSYGSSVVFPRQSYLSTNYWVDVLFTPTGPAHTVSGTISGPGGPNATVTLSGASTVVVTADASGNYSFPGLPDGSYSVTPNQTGYVFSPGIQAVILSGADTVGVNFGTVQSCPCTTIWPTLVTPTVNDGGDGNAVNVGVKFRTDTDGYIAGLRFYKSASNTGIHIGALWSSSGTQLANATFVGESASGWQQVLFDTAVPVTANTTYVASYVAPAGHYAADLTFFANSGVDNPPLHALMNGVDGGNAVFTYASTPTFPNESYQASNYWVDVIYATSPSYSIGGTVSGPGSSGATLLLSGASSTTITADASGNYSFGGLQNGTYTVTPVSNLSAFSPSSQTVTVSNGHVLNVNFTSGFGISGTITGAGGPGATVALTGSSTATVTADGSGNYTFIGLSNGSYTVTPSNGSYIFSPPSQSTVVNGTSVSGINFGSVALASVTLNPLSVMGGNSSTGTVTLSVPAPAGGAVVALSSSNTAAAQVPAAVTVSGGATTATFAVTTSPVAANASLTISATLGTTQSTNFTVTAPVAVSVSLTPASVLGGTSSTGTVTLNGPAPAAGAVVTLSSTNTAAAQVPASVTVPGNATTATFTVTTSPVSTNASATISATFGSTQTANLTVTAAVLSSLTLNPTTVPGGAGSTGTVTLTGPAPAGGAVVTLSSSNTAAAQVPASVTVPANATTATFTATTSVVAANTTATITANKGAIKTANLAVVRSLNTLSVNPTSVLGGTSSTGTVILAGAAPTGGAVIVLSSSNTAAAQVPASVTVAAGATTANFTITTSGVASNASVTISGTYGVTRTATLTVTATTLTSVTLSPTSLVGGNSSTGTVRLTGPAPSAGAVVTLSSSNTTVAQVPANVTVAGGATTATFTVTTAGVTSNASVTITGNYGGARTATLTVTTTSLSTVTVNPASVIGPTPSTGTVTLTGAAPAGGMVVTLSSSNTSAAQVPASVTVPSGASTANFTITTSTVTSNATVTITARNGIVTKTASLTVATLAANSLTVNPTSVRGGNPSTGTVTLNAPAPAGGTVVTLSSNNTSVATVPASVTVAAGNTSATFTVTTRTVQLFSRSVTISATKGGTVTATLTVTP